MKPTASVGISNLEAPSPASGAGINPNDRHLGPFPMPQSYIITQPPWFHPEIKKRIFSGNEDLSLCPPGSLDCLTLRRIGHNSYIPEATEQKKLACIILYFCFVLMAALNSLWKVKTQTHTWKPLKIHRFGQNCWQRHVCSTSHCSCFSLFPIIPVHQNQ